MYNLLVAPENVQDSLKKHILADGFDLTFDMEKSKGVYMYDAKHKRTYLDFFTCFASVPLGYNHPKMVEDETFKKNLLLNKIWDAATLKDRRSVCVFGDEIVEIALRIAQPGEYIQ